MVSLGGYETSRKQGAFAHFMAWMAGNVVVDTDLAGNIKPTKAKSPEKIDGNNA